MVATRQERKPRKKTLNDLIKANPQHFLPGMASLNRAFADANERTFRLVPMRTSLTPRFLTMDQTVLEQLGLVGEDTKKRVRKDARQRRDEQRGYMEGLKAIKARHSIEVAGWKEADLSPAANVANAVVAKGSKGSQRAKSLRPTQVELDRREQRKLEMKAELDEITKGDGYTNLCDKAAVEKSSLFSTRSSTPPRRSRARTRTRGSARSRRTG